MASQRKKKRDEEPRKRRLGQTTKPHSRPPRQLASFSAVSLFVILHCITKKAAFKVISLTIASRQDGESSSTKRGRETVYTIMPVAEGTD